MRRTLLAAGCGALLALPLVGTSGSAAGAADEAGTIKLCVTGGGPLAVFADGPDLRTANLTAKRQCRAFDVTVGQYYVGIQGYAVPDNCTLNGATVQRGKYTYRAPEQLFTHVTPGKLTKITFDLDCSLPNK
jgi:hypothetical protein